MENSQDDFVDLVQKESVEEIGETYGERVLSRWRNPKFLGRMSDASCIGKITGKCGDTIEIYLRIENDRIQGASFFTDGCACAVACGSVVIELAIGKDIDEVASIGSDTVLEALGGLPEEESHCAFLAAETLMAAIHEWMIKPQK
jgi:nitrogen fixation NifU-like protein